MDACRFCSIANGGEFLKKPENTKIAENKAYFAISSVGALVEGWTLIVPKEHCCSMKALYSRNCFRIFQQSSQSINNSLWPVVAFEHDQIVKGSATSCGTNHAHIHFVPYHSLTDNLNNTGLEWLMCTASQVDNLVGNNEYLFYCEPGNDWIDPAGRVHILKEPISQFFRKIIAEDQGNVEKIQL